MATKTLRLHTLIAAVAPITTVAVGREGDSSTVLVYPRELQPLAQPVIDAFDWSDAAQQAWEDAQQPFRTALRQAAAQAVADIDAYLALPSPTAAQVAAQVRRLSQDVKAIIVRLVQID